VVDIDPFIFQSCPDCPELNGRLLTIDASSIGREFVVITAAQTATQLWIWLPEITSALRFGTALIGFGTAVALLVRRVRRYGRQR
jgi:hypothetical protein